MSTIQLVSLVLFAVTYILMMAFQKIRPYVAVASAAIFVIMGSLSLFDSFHYTFFDALAQIDWNVILMIAGTMGTVHLFIQSKMPQLMSDILISKTPSVKYAVIALALFAGIISAFVDNVATVLMVAPVALAFCKKLHISPVPSIICIAISSNLQGAATLVGDTTSILLGQAAGLDFSDFFVDTGHVGMFWVVEAGAIASALILFWMFRKDNLAINIKSRTKVENKTPTVLLVATVLTLIAVSFIPYKDTAAPGQFYKPQITNGIVCMSYFIIGLLLEILENKNTDVFKESLKEIDYYTIILLAGLFVVIGGITKAGLVDLIGTTIAKLGGGGTKGSVFLVYTVIVWISVFLSAFIDNIPYTATMLPVVAVIAQSLTANSGIAVDPKLLYYGLLCGATLGGNLTPIGASANIAGIGILRKEGYEVKTGVFMKYGIPFTLAAVISGYLLIWLIWM